MNVICRDCGAPGDEDPNDPAPAICPTCYDKRLSHVFAVVNQFLAATSDNPNPFDICRVFEKELVEVGGETPEFAREHAKMMLTQMLFGELSLN